MAGRYTFPRSLIDTNAAQRGAAGVEWLGRLPGILAACERRWSLNVGPPFEGLSFNYAAPAGRGDGTTVVLKVCVPDKEFMTEVEALRVYAGEGAVRLLDFDLDLGAMLLERVRPGTMLSTLEDDAEATTIAAGVMRRIRRPAPEGHLFPTVGDWGRGFERLRAEFGGGSGPFPERLVDEAERLFSGLVGSMGEGVVLHGDLHHYNILAGERQPWLGIDPKGVVGEAEYETGALIRNPTPQLLRWPDLGRVLARRMDQLAGELGFERERVRGWAVAQAVLSAWWWYEDGGVLNEEWKEFMGFTELLAGVG